MTDIKEYAETHGIPGLKWNKLLKYCQKNKAVS